MQQAIATIDNCQRLKIGNLLRKEFGLNGSISAIFGNFGSSGNQRSEG
jgi:hypothetical protein